MQLFPPNFPIKMLYALLISSLLLHARPFYPPWFDSALMIFDEGYELRTCSFYIETSRLNQIS
jgi:hypothetical protein